VRIWAKAEYACLAVVAMAKSLCRLTGLSQSTDSTWAW